MGFRIVTIQTYNENKFVNTQADGENETEFKRTLKSLRIKHKQIATIHHGRTEKWKEVTEKITKDSIVQEHSNVQMISKSK